MLVGLFPIMAISPKENGSSFLFDYFDYRHPIERASGLGLMTEPAQEKPHWIGLSMVQYG